MKKSRVSFDEDFNVDEDAVAMLAKNFGRFMKNNKLEEVIWQTKKGSPHS
jgi:hypothetical protein